MNRWSNHKKESPRHTKAVSSTKGSSKDKKKRKSREFSKSKDFPRTNEVDQFIMQRASLPLADREVSPSDLFHFTIQTQLGAERVEKEKSPYIKPFLEGSGQKLHH